MNAKDKKPVSKSRLLTLIKDLDWPSAKAALEEKPDLLKYRGDKGKNLLHLCCGIDIEKRGLSAADSISTAEVLLDASLDINQEAFAEGEWKATPLGYAVAHGKNLKLAEYLVKRGADPEHCLWAAAYNDSRRQSDYSDPQYVRILLEHGARLDLGDQDGMTAGSILSRMRGPEYQKLARGAALSDLSLAESVLYSRSRLRRSECRPALYARQAAGRTLQWHCFIFFQVPANIEH